MIHMQKLTTQQLKTIFKKVKHLHLPKDLDSADFHSLKYYSWADEGDKVLYIVYEWNGTLRGIRWDALRVSSGPLQRGFCVICKKERKRDDVVFVTAETKRLPKGVFYRTRGNRICADYTRCNRDMKSDREIRNLYDLILGEV